jgi:bifunctional DNase/RNase
MTLLPAKLARIITSAADVFQTVIISEQAGPRSFAIRIGSGEMNALIARADGDPPAARPMTHDLTMHTMSALGGKLREVQITGLREGVFFARLVVDTDEGEVFVDARPSDALVLAAAEKCELSVEDEVFSAANPLL